MLASADLENLKKSAFYQRHQDRLNIPQLARLSEEIGIDPRRNLSTLLVSWNGADSLAMASGDFDPAKLETRLTVSEKYNKLTLYGDGNRDVVFLPNGIALLGSGTLLKNAIADKATGGGEISEELQLQMARVNHNAQLWFVSNGVIPLDRIGLRSDAATNFSNITNYVNAIAAGVTLASDAQFNAHLSCVSEEGAQRVRDAFKGMIGLARLSTRDDQLDQLKIWDSIHVENHGKDVNIDAALTPELADKLIALLPTASTYLPR